ncbi:helix-turn-helix domain-containing protein [Mucilaginibacter sp.]|uniref:AraC family transcriptional regulator n=1 Tax=Mucilaginibacter sp. TaxID=1882438 RepID=UPI0025D12751|nr:helix-turn-helix domain-containing protein [Mucilaginibacter sp.]
MAAHFNLFNIIVLLGALQGFILGLVLLFPGKDNRQSKYFLAFFILMLVYDTFGTFCWSSGVNIGWLAFYDVVYPYTIVFTAGPSLYLYIKTTVNGDKIPSTPIFKTYLPAIIDFGFRSCLLVYALLYNKGIVGGIKPGSIDAVYQPAAEVLMVAVFWVYLVRSISLFKKRGLQPMGENSPHVGEQSLIIKWTRALLTILVLIAVIWSATIFGSLLFNIQAIEYFSPIEIILVVFTYWIGLKGYRYSSVVYVSEQKAVKIYADAMPAEEAESCIALLKEAMETDKLYLDPSLTVGKLADALKVNSRTISAVLNRELKKGFSEFINEYRINEVKQKMLLPENKHITIAGIAFESGFNSVATFQRTFKNAENITPKQFLSTYKNKEKLMLKT